ncbi:MAG: hypothetical protein NC489_08080 [Ruminococcus flavefaciens]|nr:hypothetical protein [Ruminococcus flavefaciens]
MPKKNHDAYNESLGITQPAHIMNGTRNHKTAAELKEKYPNHLQLSVSFMYTEVWKYFRKRFHLKSFPAPLIVDNTAKYPHHTFEDGRSAWSAAFYNTSHAAVPSEDINGKTLPTTMLVSEHEIRVYSRAVRKDFDLYFENSMSIWTANLYVAHILIHELCHFYENLQRQNQLLDAEDDDEYWKIINEWMDKIDNETVDEGKEVERRTEQLAVEVFTDFIYDHVLNSSLRPILHGPMDQFRYGQKGDVIFHEALLLIRFFELKYQMDFLYSEGSGEYDRVNKELYDIRCEIVSCNQWKRLRYLITD